MSRRIAVILGVGPGLSTSLAKSLSATHSLLLLSRSLPGSLGSLNLPSNINDSNMLALSSDGSQSSLKAAFEKLKDTWPEGKVDVGIVNSNSAFKPGSFFEKTEQDLRDSLESAVVAGWNFSSTILPLFLSNSPNPTTGAKGVLLFTGATASLKGGAAFSGLSPGLFARRSLAQSLGREFGPKGVHVAHVVIDGMIDTPRVREMMGDDEESIAKRLNPDDMAQTYMSLISQPRSAWTHELEIRPSAETW